MIRYALSCEHDHAFEGWFGSSGDYDDQQARGLVACPMCASKQVRKQIMAPAVTGTRRTSREVEPARMQAMMMEAAGRIRAHVEANFDDVGGDFATEARAIHEGNAEDRGIYGEATADEVRELVEDGVPIAPMPPEPVKKSEMN